MGMWLFQNIRKNLNKSLSYDEMMKEAINSGKYYYIDVNAPEFIAPENMIEAIKTHLNKPDMTLGEVINSVYHSLAKSYKDAVCEVEKTAGIKANAIRIVGGGSKDKYLNRLTMEYTGKKVTAGPVEATALGNLASQIMADNKEYTKAAGIRPDYYDGTTIFELKPYNPRAAKAGVKQLRKYNSVLGGGKVMRMELY